LFDCVEESVDDVAVLVELVGEPDVVACFCQTLVIVRPGADSCCNLFGWPTPVSRPIIGPSKTSHSPGGGPSPALGLRNPAVESATQIVDSLLCLAALLTGRRPRTCRQFPALGLVDRTSRSPTEQRSSHRGRCQPIRGPCPPRSTLNDSLALCFSRNIECLSRRQALWPLSWRPHRPGQRTPHGVARRPRHPCQPHPP
jgi:hypothetical protein